ncbi:hypothetical protein A2U01_0057721, partial [Trifolium medium]|nr:hypothetical protein [Trifolium medium]
KRKTPEETARISIQIPKKGGGATAESDTTNAPPNPPKKKRGTRSNIGRVLLQGVSAQNPTARNDMVAQEDAEVVADNVQAPRPFCCPKSKKKQGLASFFLGRGFQLSGVRRRAI